MSRKTKQRLLAAAYFSNYAVCFCLALWFPNFWLGGAIAVTAVSGRELFEYVRRDDTPVCFCLFAAAFIFLTWPAAIYEYICDIRQKDC